MQTYENFEELHKNCIKLEVYKVFSLFWCHLRVFWTQPKDSKSLNIYRTKLILFKSNSMGEPLISGDIGTRLILVENADLLVICLSHMEV